jgi:hypothetical protein
MHAQLGVDWTSDAMFVMKGQRSYKKCSEDHWLHEPVSRVPRGAYSVVAFPNDLPYCAAEADHLGGGVAPLTESWLESTD